MVRAQLLNQGSTDLNFKVSVNLRIVRHGQTQTLLPRTRGEAQVDPKTQIRPNSRNKRFPSARECKGHKKIRPTSAGETKYLGMGSQYGSAAHQCPGKIIKTPLFAHNAAAPNRVVRLPMKQLTAKEAVRLPEEVQQNVQLPKKQYVHLLDVGVRRRQP